ncbi:unnamed protein product [Rotaria sp. Silwood2]|nr:unnamed protein product [Rotaria sp. Silwood2]CAF2995761.1 unnamed protein product [Rotaria sp. Silwood2]CAF4094396.1 unnamed protein product [Rotaria sp. Silwood2]CAF4288419.1 unnamed protein product [Rotaria sp. Silwood2]
MIIFIAATVLSYVWNSTGTTVATVINPSALALDSSGALYVVESSQNRVQKYIIGMSNSTTVAGQASAVSGSTSDFLHAPTDIAIDSSNNVYVVDKENNRVQLWASGASNGTTVAGIGGAGTAANQLNYPYNMARDSSTGTLYISDNGNNRVMKYLSGGSSGTVVAGGNGYGTGGNQLISPSGIYFDSSSNSLVIANYLGHNIVRWVLGASNWTLIAGSTTGTAGSSSTMLDHPTGLTLDSMGNIYVADTVNNRIQFFLAGQSNGTTIAGINGAAGSSAIQLSAPTAVILDSQLNIYVADTGNNRVLKFSHS